MVVPLCGEEFDPPHSVKCTRVDSLQYVCLEAQLNVQDHHSRILGSLSWSHRSVVRGKWNDSGGDETLPRERKRSSLYVCAWLEVVGSLLTQ